jgi:hypothetical protein
MNNIVNRTPYLRTTREFPEEMHQLTVEVNRSYLDIAQAVNARTIGIYPTVNPAITGNIYYLKANRPQYSFRETYVFTSAGPIPHNIDLTRIFGFVSITAMFTDGTKWYPLPYVGVVSATNQINVTIDSTNINITAGGGTPPSIVSGLITLEWISNP